MMKNILAAVAGLCMLTGAALAQEAAPAKPTTPEEWRALAQTDLDAIRKELTDNTPIPFDAINTAYPQWLARGYEEARARVAHVSDETGYFYTLAAFGNGFRDPHISVDAVNALPGGRWPGFIVSAHGENARVVMRDETDSNAPPIGAIIPACDGKFMDALAQERIFPFVLNPGLALDRRRVFTRLFLDRRNPFGAAPATCDFVIDGNLETRALQWRPLPEGQSYWNAYRDASSGPAATWGVSEPAPGVFWIGIPTFQSGDDTAPKLDQLLEDIESRGDALRQGRAIIIDTRGNGGGNSSWAMKIANAIFTRPVIGKALPRTSKQAVDWRASAENAAFWREWSSQMAKEFGPMSVNKLGADFIAARLNQALNDNPPIWRQGARRTEAGGGLAVRRAQSGIARQRSPFPAQVYFLSNGTCGSSCLNFADAVLHVPGVKLIGADTHADGPYMEVRTVTLPSGLVRLTLPQKVYRGMGRGALEAYTADIAYGGAWDDASVRTWVMDLVQKGAQ